MGKEETLRQLKAAEADVVRTKQAAADERERIMRTAREESMELLEEARRKAEERQAAILASAEAETAWRKDAILAEGRQQTEILRTEGQRNVDRAVEFLVEKFKGALNA